MRAYTEQYAYDAVGNILRMIHQAANGNWIRRYDYETSNNRLRNTSLPGDPADLSLLPPRYQYDEHGSMMKMPHLTQMDWDFKDQLQRVDLGGGGVAYYVYDATGQRVRKVIEQQNGTRQKERMYLGGFEIYREYNGSGNTVILERETLHIMDDQQRIALVETRTQGSDDSSAQLIRYQFGNHLGSASLELDDQAQIISYEEYYPYGSTSYQAVRSQTETPKRYRYTGMERDEETGFQYHTSRYLIPWLGRWGNPDPIWGNDGPNLYIYTPGSPTRFTDTAGTGFMDFVGGFFDTATFGLTRKLRNKVNQWTGADELPEEEKTINEASGTYKVGGYVGVGFQVAVGGAGIVNSVRTIGVMATAEAVSVGTGAVILANKTADQIDPSGWTSSIMNNLFLFAPTILKWFRAPAGAENEALGGIEALPPGDPPPKALPPGDPPPKALPPGDPPPKALPPASQQSGALPRDYNPPSRSRHDASKVSFPKKVTTVYHPKIDVKGDVAALNRGLGTPVGNGIYEINGRLYGIHGNSWHPVANQGKGIWSVTRSELKALRQLNESGYSTKTLDNIRRDPDISEADLNSALKIFSSMGGLRRK
jgi:RHS repeat-associated protein